MKSKRSVVVAVLSLGAMFIALIFSTSPDTSSKRYYDAAEELVAQVYNEGTMAEEVVEEKTQVAIDSPLENKSEEEKTEAYPVTRVVDGDTVKILRNGKEETLRLIGMNTPETVDPRTPVECFGKEASNKAKELLSGTKITLEFDEGEGSLDKYQRTLAYVYMENGEMFNKWMIRNGYSYEYTYDDAYKYQSDFRAAEKYARERRLGLWSPDACSGEL